MNRIARLTRLIGTLGVALCCGAASLGAGFVAQGATHSIDQAEAAAAPMTLINQDLALAQDAALAITFLPPADLAPTDIIIVGSYRRVEDRDQFRRTVAGDYGRIVDSVRVAPTDPSFSVDANGLVTITIPSESGSGVPEALQFPREGLYPVTVDVQDSNGSLIGEMLTFVNRLPAATDEDKGHLDVAVVASITAAPAVPAVDTPLPQSVLDQVNELLQYPDDTPVSISISPEVLSRLDDKTLEALRPLMARSVVLAQPSIPFDPSAAAAAGQQDMFTQLLRTGVDDATALTGTRPERSAWIESTPMTTEGAQLLADLGVELLVLSPQTYAAAGTDGGFIERYSLYSQLRNVQLPGGSSIPTAIFDPTINDNLLDSSMSPEMSALYVAAELVAWRDWLYTSLPPVTGNSVLLGQPAGGVLPYEPVARMVEMLAPTGATEFGDLSDYRRNTNVQLIDGNEAVLTLAPQQATDLAARAATIGLISARQESVSSMLVDDSGRTDVWERTIRTLRSSMIDDEQVTATVAALNAEFDAIRGAVVAPAPYTFTINGLSTNLHARISNESDERLRVVVRLRSSADKMVVPDEDPTVVLEPRAVTDVAIPVRAQSNGSFTITLQVMAPDGTTPVTGVTIIRAEVNALTGLAQMLTGGALLILITWWVRNLRRSRRQRRAEIALTSHHPARPKTPGVAAVVADSHVRTSTATATTSTATITAATAIAQLDTSTESPTPPTAAPPTAAPPATAPPTTAPPATATSPSPSGPEDVSRQSTTLSDS